MNLYKSIDTVNSSIYIIEIYEWIKKCNLRRKKININISTINIKDTLAHIINEDIDIFKVDSTHMYGCYIVAIFFLPVISLEYFKLNKNWNKIQILKRSKERCSDL